MKIFSKHNRKLEPRRRFGTRSFQDKVKLASSHKRAFNPTGGFSLKIFHGTNLFLQAAKFSGLALFLIALYYMIAAPTFLITNITIVGNRQVSTQQIEEVLGSAGSSRFLFIKKNNFFIMTQGRVNKLLTESIPAVKNVVNYHRSWPNKVTIEIAEHTPGFVIESNGIYFLVDDEGVVINQVDSPQKLLLVHDQLVENFERGEMLPNQKLAPFVTSMSKLWSSKISSPIVGAKFTGKSSNDVQFVTAAGWSVLMDATRPSSVQLSSLAVILSKEISPARQAQLAYIDLRLSKWAYYCFKASACEQQAVQGVEAGTETNVVE